jgi:4'-phosphopantetheinyl transferase
MILVAPPAAGKVHLRLVSLATAANELARLQGFLGAEELQRGNRLRDKGRRDRFYAGRGMLREMLAGYLGEEPGSIRISEGEFGKPHLSDHLGTESLSFNLSHADDLLLVAFAAAREIGVDLERVREDLPFRAMAERYFSRHEQEELFGLPLELQLAAFYRCWTRKEAYLKGAGSGFSQPSNSFDVSLRPGHPPALLAHRPSPGEIARWSIQDIVLPNGHCAALAIEGGEAELRMMGS